MSEQTDRQADADDQRKAAIYPCQEPILGEAPSAYHHMLSIKLADLIRECGCRCKENRDMCDTCEAAVAMEVDGPAVLAAAKVVDPKTLAAVNEHGNECEVQARNAEDEVERLEQQLAALRAGEQR